MSTELSSLERAFRDRCGGAMLGEDCDAEQLDLLRDPETGKLPGNVFQLVRKQGPRGAGRPPGAGNKRNERLAQLVCQQHGDPVLYMASLYSRPIDQMVELVKIADGSDDLTQRLVGLAESVEAGISEMLRKGVTADQRAQLDRLVDRLADIAKILRPKIGDLAIKAINLQLAAARAVAEYVHSKKPVEANVNVRSDGVLVMAAPPAGGGFEEADATVRLAADRIAEMLSKGHIEPAQLADYRLEGGQLVDADFAEIPDDEDAG